jgi:hypothetical protein
MIDVNTFLAEAAENRRRAQSAARVGSAFVADHCELPPALDLILRMGGLIQPQLARSPFAPRSSRVGVPSRERAQVEYWWRCYGEDANWLLDTQVSGMLAIEFSVYATPCNLFRRACEYQAFKRTLRYGTPKRTFALFSIPPGRSMCRGWDSGIHWKTSVLIPPSRASWELDCDQEFEYSYLDPSAPLLPAPETLLGPPVQYF